MKLKKLLFLALIGVLSVAIIACSNDYTDDLTDSNSDLAVSENSFPLASSMSDYGIEGEHRFFEVGMDEALQLLEDEAFDGIIYFGFPGCPWCQSAVPIMHEVSQQTNTDIFYVSRRHEIRETEDWQEWDAEMAWWLDEKIDMDWIYDASGEPDRPNIFVPQIIHLQNGAVIDAHRGTLEGHDAMTQPELTSDEHARLLDIYIRIFSSVNVPAF